jgi:uncharacterized protein YdeI (YjbR/CyaY-like superfamily)
MARDRDFEAVEIRSRADLRAWLEANHGRSESIWLVTHKKRPGAPHVSYREIVEEALCFCWVDSLPRKLDEHRSRLLLSPRKRGSNWSRINKERVAALTAAGLMTPAGLAKVEQAKADGSWTALDTVETMNLPPDLAEAMAANATAERFFGAFSRSSRRAILEWIANARRPETRAARIAETIRLAARNIKANHPEGRNHGVGGAVQAEPEAQA